MQNEFIPKVPKKLKQSPKQISSKYKSAAKNPLAAAAEDKKSTIHSHCKHNQNHWSQPTPITDQ